MLNLLDEQLISTVSPQGDRHQHSLAGTLAGLARGEIASFSSLRAHQRHVWHAFLVQIATLALENAGEKGLPDYERAWRDLLNNLTPGWREGEPWSLIVHDATKPALMQAPVQGGDLSSFRAIETPDHLDMLVTSKNHDLKSQRMWNSSPEDWLFALISLQTQEGIMGAGKYGVSRMNGGYGSRPMFGIDLEGSTGFRFRRDVAMLLAAAKESVDPNGLSRKGISLVWLNKWDGSTQIPFRDLHPLYIEICRRIRLRNGDARIIAMDSGSNTARISGAGELRGNTGDPWTPVSIDGKAFSVGREGFSYRKMSELLNPAKFCLPALAQLAGNDSAEGVVLVAQSVCRGQGKTEGYHERRIPLPKGALSSIVLNQDDFTKITEKRVSALSELRMAFRFALFVLGQGGPEKISADKDTTKRFVEPWLERLESAVDPGFFDDLLEELSAPEADRDTIFESWLRKQLTFAQKLLLQARQSLPYPSMRRYRAQAQAGIAFRAKLAKSAPFQSLLGRQEMKEVPDALNRNGQSQARRAAPLLEHNRRHRKDPKRRVAS
jgi:CRISPR system Cascade subunit CasA